MTSVIENLVVHAGRMHDNIYLTHGLVFSQRVMLRLTEAGLSREEAYALVQRNAMRCWDEERPLLDLLQHDSDIRAVLSAEEISALFTLEPYLAHVNELFARVGLGERKRRRRRAARAREAEHEHAPPEDSMPVQNIEDRASDWYETVLTTTDWISRTPVEADETLGEADHQKRPARRDAAQAKRPAPRKRPAKSGRKSAAASKPEEDKEKAETAATTKPATEGEDQKKPPRRRRGTRGGRRKKKTNGEKPVFSDDDDDSYVD
jgi:hypothetical protein